MCALSLSEMHFHRRWCVNPAHLLRYPLARMDLHHDFLAMPERGDPYPLLARCGDPAERVENGRWVTENPGAKPASLCRMVGGYFPFTTSAVRIGELSEGAALGVCVRSEGHALALLCRRSGARGELLLRRDGEEVSLGESEYAPGTELRIALAGVFFDLWTLSPGGEPCFLHTGEYPPFADIARRDIFSHAEVAVICELPAGGAAACEGAESYLDAGAAQADLRPICYEDGSPMLEDGRLYLTLSVRNRSCEFQAVCSLLPGSCDLRMEGAHFFDQGDGRYGGGGASCVRFDRATGLWYVWSISFYPKHILCHAVARTDLRHGLHLLRMTEMPTEKEGEEMPTLSDDRLFLGKFGDEDPALFFDTARREWLLCVCRVIREGEEERYCYHLFRSRDPFDGFVFDSRTEIGSNTGGSFLRVGGKLVFVCGSDFSARARYDIFDPEDGMRHLGSIAVRHDDGGFRGWGSIVPIPCGSDLVYHWITFDRQLSAPEGNWSYGNIYCFESDETEPIA